MSHPDRLTQSPIFKRQVRHAFEVDGISGEYGHLVGNCDRGDAQIHWPYADPPLSHVIVDIRRCTIEGQDLRTGKVRQDAFQFAVATNKSGGVLCSCHIRRPTIHLLMEGNDGHEELMRRIRGDAICQVAIFGGRSLTLQNAQVVRVKDKQVLHPFRWFGVAYFLPQSHDFLEIRIVFERTGDRLDPIGFAGPLFGLENRQFAFELGKSAFDGIRHVRSPLAPIPLK